MKKIGIALGVLLQTLLVFVGCRNNDKSLGVEIQPKEDEIVVASDTFLLDCENYYVPSISAQADTMILGEFYSSKYGNTKAELILQLAPPVGYEFPSDDYNPTPDSLALIMFYDTWFGSAYAPLEMSIYELNKEPIVYNRQYFSNLEPGDFTDSTILMGKRLVTSVDLSRVDSLGNDTALHPYVKYKFDEEQLLRFFNMPHSAYDSEEAFLNEFKGLYITTRYGSSSMLHFNQIELVLYYHYTYRKNGRDTIVNTTVSYPANKEVRQLNRFFHRDIADIAIAPDSVVYLKSAAGIYPKVRLPMGRIAKRMYDKIGDKDFNINGAEIEVEIVDYEDTDVYLTPPEYLLALTTEEFDDFIRYNTVPTAVDTTAVLAGYRSSGNSYIFDLNYLLTKHLRSDDIDDIEFDRQLELMLIPVHIEGTVSSVSSITPLTKLSAVSVRSGRNTYSPMRLKLLYNGF